MLLVRLSVDVRKNSGKCVPHYTPTSQTEFTQNKNLALDTDTFRCKVLSSFYGTH